MTSSPVTVRTTSGPVMNMWLVPCTMKMKSVSAGEYTAPPAEGPSTTLICGTTPDVARVAEEDPAEAVQGDDALLDARPPPSMRPMSGTPVFRARSWTLWIFSAWASPSEPPKTVKSWL